MSRGLYRDVRRLAAEGLVVLAGRERHRWRALALGGPGAARIRALRADAAPRALRELDAARTLVDSLDFAGLLR